jgi:uncharacterized protein YndB with AHSA1/START domain
MPAIGVVNKSPGGYDVTFERLIHHPVPDVWAMLSEPDNIAKWFCARVDIDGRLGGRMVEHHDHVRVDVFGEITRWEPPLVFEHSWWFGDSPETPRDSVLWELFPEESGTRLVLTDRRRSLDGAEGGLAGRHVCLDVLSAVLDGANPKDHAPPEGDFRDGQFVQSRAGRGRWADGERLTQEYKRISPPSSLSRTRANQARQQNSANGGRGSVSLRRRHVEGTSRKRLGPNLG